MTQQAQDTGHTGRGTRRTPVMYRVTASTLARALEPHGKAPRTGMAFSTGEARLNSRAGSTAVKAHRDEWHRTGHVILPADVLNALHAAVVDMGRKAVYLVLGAYALQVTTAVGDRELVRFTVARREAIGCQSGFSAHSRRPNECRHCKKDKTEHEPVGLWATLGVVPAGQEPYADGLDAMTLTELRDEAFRRGFSTALRGDRASLIKVMRDNVDRFPPVSETALPAVSHVDAVRAIRAAAPDVTPTGYRYNDHSNELGDWCPWSLAEVTEAGTDDTRCPAGCPGSAVEETQPVDNSPEAVRRERVERERVLIRESRDGVRARREAQLEPVTPLDVQTPPLDYGQAAPVLIIRGADMRDFELRTDSIDERHVFHYATHSVEWSITYGPEADSKYADHFTRNGEAIHVWCDYRMTRESAESGARQSAKDGAILHHESRVIVHERTEDRGSSITLPLRLRLDVDDLMNAGHTVDEARNIIISDVREYVALELGGTAKWSDRLSGVECAGYAWCSEVIGYGTRSASQCDNEALPGTWPPNCGGKH